MPQGSPPSTFARLCEEKARIKAQLKEIESGLRQDLLRRKLPQIETASQIDRWLISKELEPPK